MTSEDHIWQEDLFHQALDLEIDEREAFLRNACSEDPSQVSAILSLIDALENDSGFLESAGFKTGLAVLAEQKPTPTLAGTIIGHYEVGEKIGEGGMGEVYDAFDTKLNRRVALKFLASPYINDNTARRQLIREAQAAAMLNHANICSIYDIEHIGKHTFIAMEYINGTTLAEAIRVDKFHPETLTNIIRQIVGAAAFAHSAGVIHRDLKPANIMVEPEGDGKIKVLDFGLAKMVKPISGQEGQSFASQNGMIIGTVAYMSPEQLRGERLDYQSDIFSIGVTLYELIAGKNPFARDNQADTISAILTGEAPPLTDVDPSVSTDMSDIVIRCMQIDKQKRFQSAAEVLVALANATNRRKPPPRKIWRLLTTLFAALFMVTVIGLLFLRTQANTSHSIAVLPFTMVNLKPENDYLADGIPQGISEKLESLSELKVRNESFTTELRGEQVVAEVVGRELQVEAVLTGKIIESNTGIVLLTNLVRSADGVVIDTGEHKIDEKDLDQLQKDISERVAVNLKIGLSNVERTRLATSDTKSPEAKQEYIRGRHVFEKQDPDSLKVAIEHFRKATNLDPAYARAWTGLADAYSQYNVPGYIGEMDPKEAATLASAAAKKALEIDSTLAEPYVSQGVIKIRSDWDWEGAEIYLRGAITRNPDYAPAHLWLSNLLVLRSRYAEAMEEAQKARTLSPYGVLPRLAVVRVLYFSGKFGEMDRYLDDSLEAFPDQKRLMYFRSLEYLALGRNAEAAKILEATYRENRVFGAAPLGLAYGRMGQKEKALKILSELEKISKDPEADFVSGQEFAIIHLGLSEKDKAFDALHKACQEKFSAFPFVITDPIFAEMRTDARFNALKKCANL